MVTIKIKLPEKNKKNDKVEDFIEKHIEKKKKKKVKKQLKNCEIILDSEKELKEFLKIIKNKCKNK